ncbi:hypothetical protein L1887_19318 [Cichorium endivia]|nr:hypothetical protein L1887_19318 [Cichorium endivia]
MTWVTSILYCLASFDIFLFAICSVLGFKGVQVFITEKTDTNLLCVDQLATMMHDVCAVQERKYGNKERVDVGKL